MFTFINSSVLFFLSAVLIPILIHLLNKRRKKKIKFSSTRFLRTLEKKRLKRIRLYEYLILVLRSLIVLSLVLAFARPTFNIRSGSGMASARSTSVIILDNGLNMQRYDQNGNRFIRAKQALNQLLAQFNPDDVVFILQSTNQNNTSKELYEEDDLKISFRGGDWSASIDMARHLFDTYPNLNMELFIISDFQFYNPAFWDELGALTNIQKTYLRIGEDLVENVSIDSVIIQNRIFEKDKPINIDVLLSMNSKVSSSPTEIHLFIEDQRVAHARKILSPMSQQTISLSFQTKLSGIIGGYVEISDDDLLADNRFYFAIKIPEKINILFVDDNPSPYLEAAFSALAQYSDIKVVTEMYSTWAKQVFNNFDILFLSNVTRLPEMILQRLDSYMKKGGSVVLMPGLSATAEELNRQLSFWDFKEKIADLENSQSREQYFILAKPDVNNPLMSGVFRTKNTAIAVPRFYKYFKFQSVRHKNILLSFDNGDPFLFRSSLQQGSLLVFTSYIDNKWTDLQFRGMFVPLLVRVLYLASANQDQIQQPAVVEREKIFTLSQLKSSGDYSLILPNGKRRKVVPEFAGVNPFFHFKYLDTPGLYQLISNGDLLAAFPVNFDNRILKQPFINLELNELNPNLNQIIPESEIMDNNIKTSRVGIELWKFFIFLALILLFFEIIYIRKIENRSKNRDNLVIN